MKKFILILAVTLTVLIFAGCASVYGGSTASISGAPIEKIAEETNTVWFGVFGTHNYPPAAQLAMDNDIKRIAFIDRYYKIGVFGLWIEYTTIVVGE